MTTPGIGASGLMGLAFESLAIPVLSSVTPSAGGALTAGAYRYVISAINAAGETTQSNELTGTTAAGNLTNALVWVAVPGATGYRIYRTAAGGGTGTELFLAAVGAVTTYNDAAVGAPAGALPTSNTANTPGVYAPPVKYIPFTGDGLKYLQGTDWRRPIRNTPGIVGAIPGDSHVEGDLTFELLSDTCLYFLQASRCTVVKTGTGPYTYVYTPAPIAVPSRTLSITIVRNGVVFGYVGCVVGSFKITINNGVLEMTASIIGRDEASQSAPTAVWPTTTPYGAGSYSFQIPTATQQFDADTFEFSSNDNANAQFRIKNTGTGAQFVSFGESAAEIKTDRDFLNRTEYDAFKALTAKSITFIASKSANESITIVMPVAVTNTYETNIGGQGDLVRATMLYEGVIDGAGKAYQVTCVSPTENVV